jgi:DNA-binding transcriptional regulator YiaG
MSFKGTDLPFYFGHNPGTIAPMPLSKADLLDLAEAVRMSRDGTAKALRIDLGIGAAAVGAACGVTASTITRWENGDRRPTGRPAITWVRLIRRLGAKSFTGERTGLSPTSAPDAPGVISGVAPDRPAP